MKNQCCFLQTTVYYVGILHYHGETTMAISACLGVPMVMYAMMQIFL